MIITIDGPVGTGKSTIAKLLAKNLGFIHFDTGAMYRSVTYAVLSEGIDPENKEALKHLLENFDFSISMINDEKHYFVNGKDVTDAIRKEAVTSNVSKVASYPIVRAKLVELQKKFGATSDAVFEGRDIGTVVFPNAELKIFLTADAKVRAKRRLDELVQKFPEESKDLNFEKVLASIELRDIQDTTRKISPLKKAENAHVVDCSKLTIEEVLSTIIALKKQIDASLK